MKNKMFKSKKNDKNSVNDVNVINKGMENIRRKTPHRTS